MKDEIKEQKCPGQKTARTRNHTNTNTKTTHTKTKVEGPGQKTALPETHTKTKTPHTKTTKTKNPHPCQAKPAPLHRRRETKHVHVGRHEEQGQGTALIRVRPQRPPEAKANSAAGAEMDTIIQESAGLARQCLAMHNLSLMHLNGRCHTRSCGWSWLSSRFGTAGGLPLSSFIVYILSSVEGTPRGASKSH